MHTLGAYSAMVALTAPICMFLMFRCAESISLAHDKKREFSLLLTGSVTIFLALGPLFFLAGRSLGVGPIFCLLILAFKPLEMIAELTNTAFIARKSEYWATRSCLARVAGVVLLTNLLDITVQLAPLITVGLSLLFTYSAVFLLHDLPRLRSSDLLELFGVNALLNYVKRNFGLGALNFTISFNSSLPRYVLAEQSGLAALGTFALMYQIAATLVNILQYPVSLNAAYVLLLVRRHSTRLNVICVTGIAVASLSLSLLLLGTAPDFPNPPYNYQHITIAGTLTLAMLIALATRGTLLTALIASRRHSKMYLLVLASTATAATLSSPALLTDTLPSLVYGATIYVIFSSFFSGALALRRILRPGDLTGN